MSGNAHKQHVPEESTEERRIVDIHSNKSNRPGMAGILESFLRTYRNAAFAVVALGVIAICMFVAGMATIPAVFLHEFVQTLTQHWQTPWRQIVSAIAIPFYYFSYGVSVLFLAPLFNKLNPWKLKASRGNWFGLSSIPWFYHNALTYLVRFTFLDFVTPSPLNTLFFKMMGMKIGKGVMINTPYISDPCMITLEDHVTVGGSATIFAHYGQKGILIISPVVIGKGATIGLKASIMGDVVVGPAVVVPPHSVLLPKTRLLNNGQSAAAQPVLNKKAQS
jgi:hypothetical protein